MRNQIKDDSFTKKVAERITINSVLSSRVYLNDSKKFAENLTEISTETDFAVGIDTNATFNEQYTEALNAELYSYFSPISPADLFDQSKNPDFKRGKFIYFEDHTKSQEGFYISEKYVIKYSEGVFKISPNTNYEILQYIAKIHKQNPESLNSDYFNFQHMPKDIIKEIEKLEPRFSFGLYNSAEIINHEDGSSTKQRTSHIAFRGTEPDIKEFSKTDTNKNEFIKYFLEDYPNMTHHYDFLQPFIEQATKLSKESNIHNMEITGHSLGGAMVDVFLQKNKNNPYLEDVTYQGFAFGNPFGISTRNKIEQVFEGEFGQKLQKNVDKLLDVSADTVVNEIRKKVRQTGKQFMNVGINTGIALGCTLTHIEPNDMTQNYVKNVAKKWGFEVPALLSSVGIRFICNLCKIAKQSFSPEQVVDENFKKIEDNPNSRLISVQHSGDPVPTGGSLLYQHKGNRYLVSDKNEVFGAAEAVGFTAKVMALAGKTLEKVTGYNLKNHKAYNYVSSCVQRVDFTTDSALAQAIRNVNHTFESVSPDFERTNDCRNIFEKIKTMRNKAYPVVHSVDKQIPA